MIEATRCAHCADPNPPGEQYTLEREEKTLEFCCMGCRTAYRIITGSGLEQFYSRRQWDETGIPEGAYNTSYSGEYLQQFVRMVPEGAQLSVLVEGVRCASCVWVIERILQREPGILRARLSNSTHILRVLFDPGQISAARIFAHITRLGYLPRPHTAVAAEEMAVREMRSLLVRFGTAVFLSMQLMGFSLGLYAGYFAGMSENEKVILSWLAGVVSTPVVFYCGAPFLAGARRSLANRAPDMDLLVATGVLSAWLYSAYSLLTGGEVYFDSAAMIVTFLLLGRLLESYAKRRAASGIARILRLAPDTAARVREGVAEEVPSGLLQEGDLVQVNPGQRFPADGTMVSGSSDVDESAVTGEPFPVHLGVGSPVTSGTLNLTASVRFTVTRSGSRSFVARIAQLVSDAQSRKPPIQEMTDRLAAWFVPAVLLLAVATFAFWTLRDGFGPTDLLTAVSVLVVACPCALGLATPTAVVVATGAAASAGALFKGGDVLQELGRADVVVFDKTGTLTHGEPSVRTIQPAPGENGNSVLTAAAKVEAGSSHPIARAILGEAGRAGIVPSGGAGREISPGKGVRFMEEGTLYRAGSRRFLEEAGVAVPDLPAAVSGTEVLVSAGEKYLGRILLDDTLREEAPGSVERFRKMMKRMVILSGDREETVLALARELGIEEAHGNMTPEDKAAFIADLHRDGSKALMVGDGINDAPALAEARVGSAITGGSDVALEVSDLVLVRARLDVAAMAVTTARKTLKIIRENLAWAMIYNIVALGFSVSGRLEPIHAAAAMAMSSVCVVLNSLRLARVRKEGT